MQSQDVAVVRGDFVHLRLESCRLDDFWGICRLWRLQKGSTGKGCEPPTEELGDSGQNTDRVFNYGERRWADAATHRSLHMYLSTAEPGPIYPSPSWGFTTAEACLRLPYSWRVHRGASKPVGRRRQRASAQSREAQGRREGTGD